MKITTIILNGDINNIVQLHGEAGRIVRAQPGYVRSKPTSLMRTAGGARLYVLVGLSWMDASLEDITDPIITNMVE